jgi:hypothetical protein
MNKIINGKHMTLVLFVDDILILSERDADTERFIKQLRDKYIEVSFCVDSNLSYLGMHVRVEAGKTVLSMRSYVAQGAICYRGGSVASHWKTV